MIHTPIVAAHAHGMKRTRPEELEAIVGRHLSALLEEVEPSYAVLSNLISCYKQVLISRKKLLQTERTWLALVIDGHLYIIERNKALGARIVDGNIILDLEQLIRLPEEEQPSHLMPALPLPVPSAQRDIAPRPSALYQGYEFFTLPACLERASIDQEEEKQDIPTHLYEIYVSFLCDHVLLTTQYHLRAERQKLEEKVLRRYNQRGAEKRHRPLLFAFLSQVILHDARRSVVASDSLQCGLTLPGKDLTTVRHMPPEKLTCRLVEECIAFEMFLFQHWEHAECGESLALFAQHIDAHVQFMKDMALDGFPLPVWIGHYHVNEKGAPRYWQRREDLYEVRFEWLVHVTDLSPETGKTCHHGLITLTHAQFCRHFVPHLYRESLFDVCRLLMMQAIQKGVDCRERSLFPIAESGFKESVFDALPMVTGREMTGFYLYNLTHGDPCSPVTKRMIEYDRLMDEKKALEREGCGATGVDRPMPDIEDLPRYLPPCLKPFIGTRVHLKDQDRYTVIKYLIDMGYSEADMLRSLGENNDKNALRGQYHWSKRKWEKTQPERTSLNCGGIANINTDDGNSVRCPYESRCTKKGDRKRRDYNTGEKREFKNQCARSLKLSYERGEYLNHPIDYVQHKLNKS